VASISSTLKMEAICSSETSVDIQRTTWRYIPEDSTLHNHRCENLRPAMSNLYVSSNEPEVNLVALSSLQIIPPDCNSDPVETINNQDLQIRHLSVPEHWEASDSNLSGPAARPSTKDNSHGLL
jgi:hypothetical protein